MTRLIDADALQKRVDEHRQNHCENCTDIDCIDCFVNEVINKIPKVEEREKGHWEEFEFEYADNEYVGYRCSECGSQCLTTDFERYNYCPECGAKMEGEE